MKEKYLVSIFLKQLYQGDGNASESHVQKALLAANRYFLKQTKPMHTKKDLLHYYYKSEGRHLTPNHKNYELLDVWDAYAPFHSEHSDMSLPLLKRIYRVQLLNYKLRLEQHMFFQNRSAL